MRSNSIPRRHADLEFFLIRTLPLVRTPRNLKVIVWKVASNWEAPKHQVLPATIFESQYMSCLDGRPTQDPAKTTFMFTRSIGYDDYTTIDDGIPLENKDLGIIWEAELSFVDRLGKRVPGINVSEFRKHSLQFSHLGVPCNIPQSPELITLLEEKSLPIIELGESLGLQEQLNFRIRLDDVSKIFELCFYPDNCEIPVTKEVYHFAVKSPWDQKLNRNPEESEIILPKYGQKLQDYDDPQMAVYHYIRQLIEGRAEGVGILSVLNSVVASVNIWIKAHANSGAVPESLCFEELVSPFVALLRWSDAVYIQFFKPLLLEFHPELLAARVNAIPPRKSDRADPACKTKSVQQKNWEQGAHFFARIQQLEAVLRDATQQRNLQILRRFWLDTSVVNLSDFWFPSHNIQQVALTLISEYDVGKCPIFCLQTEAANYREVQSVKIEEKSEWKGIVSSDATRTKLFIHVMLPFVWPILTYEPTLNQELASIPKLKFAALKAPSQRIPPIDLFSSESRADSLIQAAVKYEQIVVMVILWLSESEDVWTLQLCLSDQQENLYYHKIHGTGSEASFETDDTFFYPRGDRLLTTTVNWASGRMAWIALEPVTESSTYSISILDFRRCAKDITVRPEFYKLIFVCSEFGRQVDYISTDDGTWTMGSEFVWWLGYEASKKVPILIEGRATSPNIRTHQLIDWRSHFTPDELRSLSYVDPFSCQNSLVAAEERQTLFMSLLQPQEDLKLLTKDKPENQLWIICFRFGHRRKPTSFLCRKRISVNHNLILRTKVIFIQSRNFLLLSLGCSSMLVFTVVRYSLVQLTVNGAYVSRLPKPPGELVLLRGMYRNSFAPFFVEHRVDRLAGKILLDLHTLRFTY